MLIITKCSKIVGAIPSEQHIEFLRNRSGEMVAELSHGQTAKNNNLTHPLENVNLHLKVDHSQMASFRRYAFLSNSNDGQTFKIASRLKSRIDHSRRANTLGYPPVPAMAMYKMLNEQPMQCTKAISQ